MLVLAVALVLPLFLAACLNNVGSSATGRQAASTSSTTTTSSSSNSTASFTILSATVGTASGNTPPTATLAFNANSATRNLNDVCIVQASSSNNDAARACKCRYVWAETNASDSSVNNRTVDTDPTQITKFQVQCPVPKVYSSEIADNTIVKISFVPDTAKGNNSGFSTNQFNFKKTSTGTTGDFRDVEGRSYKNIFHYVCYDKWGKALSIQHKVTVATTDPTTGEQHFLPLANEFETGTQTISTYSAQSYYYDFYVRSNEIGSINSGNESFTCPMVNVNGLPSFYPLDSSFALALNPSKDFNLAVTAPMVITTQSLTIETLGYAAKPNSDGTCPAFLDSNGKIRRTFRLRQFSAIYPLRFDANGDVKDQAQALNVVYVLDRPVDKTGQDPMKPITRLGPKPCPFSYKTAQFGYKCMSDATLSGWNIDGTQITGDPACPIYPPPPPSTLKSDGTLVVRPYKPFVPHFLENTAFKACAFQSGTPVDPEIALSHDDGVFTAGVGPFDFYCAKHYPAAGAIIPPPNGDPFDKPPGDCSLSDSATAIKTDKTFACAKSYDPYNGVMNTPQAGCCQICSGSSCVAQGGGTTAAGRNGAFSPPQDVGNPAQAMKLLQRAVPNQTGGGGCFDPFEP
ncbi:MAG: hypothetical protein HYW49_09215 [Deltaproteobacteria bacterium]|nr:hypothetical protein [Deltaproteobacteria bacterium]